MASIQRGLGRSLRKEPELALLLQPFLRPYLLAHLIERTPPLGGGTRAPFCPKQKARLCRPHLLLKDDKCQQTLCFSGRQTSEKAVCFKRMRKVRSAPTLAPFLHLLSLWGGSFHRKCQQFVLDTGHKLGGGGNTRALKVMPVSELTVDL